MFAIVQLGGKQYKVQEGDVIRIEKLDIEESKKTIINEVLLVSDGKETKIGTPFVSGAGIELKILKTALADKVTVFKMRAGKRYKRLRGHRQPYSEVEILKITA